MAAGKAAAVFGAGRFWKRVYLAHQAAFYSGRFGLRLAPIPVDGKKGRLLPGRFGGGTLSLLPGSAHQQHHLGPGGQLLCDASTGGHAAAFPGKIRLDGRRRGPLRPWRAHEAPDAPVCAGVPVLCTEEEGLERAGFGADLRFCGDFPAGLTLHTGLGFQLAAGSIPAGYVQLQLLHDQRL